MVKPPPPPLPSDRCLDSFTHVRTDVGKAMDESVAEIQRSLAPHLAQFGQRHDNSAKESIFDILESGRFAERKNV